LYHTLESLEKLRGPVVQTLSHLGRWVLATINLPLLEELRPKLDAALLAERPGIGTNMEVFESRFPLMTP
jgi:hypothetical protein